ncbi:TolC family protein [Brevundimonas sp.]|uniref:TolC family protein n=1 Tax=Brevundimonas sp. TaxID=1871086 RepID=UPI001AC7D627|nr:TolC family protein [Brevundimonas sp.]MBN9464929.1 TolC family protein [Brevundimonas sp.]
MTGASLPSDRTRAPVVLVGALATALLSGCATYQSAPLPDAPRADPSATDLAAAAAGLDHPRLPPLDIDFAEPLSPDQLGVIAVIASPELRAQRARLGVAEAQVFDAGLLPDPQFSFSLDRPVSGMGLVDALAAGLGMDTSSFLARPLRQRGAGAGRDQVRLEIAWQEWQAAGQARLLAARILGLEQGADLARAAATAADDALDRTLRAVARGDLSANDLEARRISAADAGDRARVAERDLQAARLDLNAALGLSPETRIRLASPPSLPRAVPEATPLVLSAYSRRLDLAALRRGYEGQDADLRLALLQQYPRLNLSLNAARDTGAVRTNGIAVGFDLPLWNRNRGAIGIQTATRAQLRAEYEARLFATRSEITSLVAAYRLGLDQRDALAAQVGPLRQTVEAFERAGARGDIARITAETARQALTDKAIALVALDQALAEQWVALELASGGLLGEHP